MTGHESRSGGGRGATALLWVAIALVVVLLLPLRQVDVAVEIYGVEVAVWLLAVVFYLVGVLAGFAAFMARRG